MLEGVHPRFITEGYEIAKNKSILSLIRNRMKKIKF